MPNIKNEPNTLNNDVERAMHEVKWILFNFAKIDKPLGSQDLLVNQVHDCAEDIQKTLNAMRVRNRELRAIVDHLQEILDMYGGEYGISQVFQERDKLKSIVCKLLDLKDLEVAGID